MGEAQLQIHPDLEREVMGRIAHYLPMGMPDDYGATIRALKRVCADYAVEAHAAKAREMEAIENRRQTGWLIERHMTPSGQEYLFVNSTGVFAWTTNPLLALRFPRKEDANSLVAIVEDAVRVAEHTWITGAAIPTDRVKA